MRLYYILVILVLLNSSLFGYWQDPKFPETLGNRYPRYREQILKLNEEINFYFKMISRDPQSPIAQKLLADKSKEFADLICEAARKEINDQIEESEFEKM